MDEHRAHGPWTPADLPLPPGVARAAWRGKGGVVALEHGEARLAAERAGFEALADHPARPRVLAWGTRSLVLAPLGEVAAPEPPDGRWVRRQETRRALLREVSRDVRLDRALGKLGAKRRDVDRYLDETVDVALHVGPTFGGLPPGAWRAQEGRGVGLRMDRARAEGWTALDAPSVEGAPDEAAAAEGLELARIAWALREAAHGDEGAAAEVLERLRAAPDPARTRVWIEGPDFVDPALWESPGAEVTAARARWLLTHLDGLAVGGGELRVRTDPPVRRGRRAPLREPRAARRRRLFSRWERGVRVDDEGLYSLTPEALADRIAEGARGVVLDATCGVGGLAIAYARQPGVERVIAVDADPERVAMTAHNAAIYGVADRVEPVVGDALDVVRSRRADLLVIDPPWGGRAYDRDAIDLDDLDMDVRGLLDAFDGPVVLKLPRSFDVAALPGLTFEALVDARGVLKMLIARR